MTGNEFLHALRITARRNGVAVWIDTRQGKGSHVVVHYGSHKTTLKDRRKELPRTLLRRCPGTLG
jgi:mRNA interferase HicA